MAHDAYCCLRYPLSTMPHPNQRQGNEFVGMVTNYDEGKKLPQCPVECRPKNKHSWAFCYLLINKIETIQRSVIRWRKGCFQNGIPAQAHLIFVFFLFSPSPCSRPKSGSSRSKFFTGSFFCQLSTDCLYLACIRV